MKLWLIKAKEIEDPGTMHETKSKRRYLVFAYNRKQALEKMDSYYKANYGLVSPVKLACFSVTFDVGDVAVFSRIMES